MAEEIEITAGELIKRCTVKVTVTITGAWLVAARLFFFRWLFYAAAGAGGFKYEVEVRG